MHITESRDIERLHSVRCNNKKAKDGNTLIVASIMYFHTRGLTRDWLGFRLYYLFNNSNTKTPLEIHKIIWHNVYSFIAPPD